MMDVLKIVLYTSLHILTEGVLIYSQTLFYTLGDVNMEYHDSIIIITRLNRTEVLSLIR